MSESSTKDKLARLEARKATLLKKLKSERSEKTIRCASCKSYHKIKDLACIQTHWYEEPHGCTGGDNWWPGGLEFLCPTKNERNRLLFRGDKREGKFKEIYKYLFKSIENTHTSHYQGEQDKRSWTNNYYVSENPDKFELD